MVRGLAAERSDFMTVEISMLIAIVGCFVGLAGWLSGRDKKIANDGKWRGSVDTKLDQILPKFPGFVTMKTHKN